MIRPILGFVSQVASSRVAWFLFVIHLCLVVFDFAQKQPVSIGCNDEWDVAGADLIAGRFFHLHYESTLIKVVLLLDTPGILLSMLFGLLLMPLGYLLPQPCLYTSSWIAAIFMLVGTSIQWLIIGYGVERILRRKSYA